MNATERLVVAYNPTSSRARKVSRDVLGRLDDAGVAHTDYVTKYPSANDNIADIQAHIQPGDIWISAAGDGTGMQLANAALLSGVTADVQLGFLGYGNFKDLSEQKDPLALLGPSAVEVLKYPLAIEVNDEHWRYSPGYATLGVTALLAASFGDEHSRQLIQHLPDIELIRMAASIALLGKNYFAYRNNHLPPFRTSQSAVQHAVTDVLFLNNQRAGRIIKSDIDYSTEDYFGYHTNDVSAIAPNLPFGLKALAGHAPAEHLKQIELNFDQPSLVPAQTEGEFELLQDVSRFSVRKDPTKVLRIIQASNTK